jgi:hypothetical protein
MEWLFSDFAACPQDITLPPNQAFKTLSCPVDPETEEPWFKPL